MSEPNPNGHVEPNPNVHLELVVAQLDLLLLLRDKDRTLRERAAPAERIAEGKAQIRDALEVLGRSLEAVIDARVKAIFAMRTTPP